MALIGQTSLRYKDFEQLNWYTELVHNGLSHAPSGWGSVANQLRSHCGGGDGVRLVEVGSAHRGHRPPEDMLVAAEASAS